MPNRNKSGQQTKSSPITRGGESKRKSFRKRALDAPEWDAVPAALIHAIVCAASTCNAPPTFGYTRDGTALTLAVYYDNERYLDYLSGPEEVAEWFDWLIDELLPLSEQERMTLRQARLE